MNTSLKIVAAIAVALLATPALARLQAPTPFSQAPVATNSPFNSAYNHALGVDRDPAIRLGPDGMEVRD